jgi:uncharacterized protein
VTSRDDKSKPWWRYPIVWLVIAGPVAVILAGFWTLKLAMAIADPVLTVSPDAQTQVRSLADQPAVQARNHAATGQVPVVPKP